jgi:hypothetical protein
LIAKAGDEALTQIVMKRIRKRQIAKTRRSDSGVRGKDRIEGLPVETHLPCLRIPPREGAGSPPSDYATLILRPGQIVNGNVAGVKKHYDLENRAQSVLFLVHGRSISSESGLCRRPQARSHRRVLENAAYAGIREGVIDRVPSDLHDAAHGIVALVGKG